MLCGLSRAANHGRLWLGVAAVLGARKGTGRRAAVRAMGSLAISSALTNVVAKSVFHRRRPNLADHPPVRRLRREPISSSFPSGHSASAAAFATAVAMESPLLAVAVAPLATAVAYSRVHVGVHYPGDVVAGSAIGAGVALATRHWWPVHPAVPARVRLTSVAAALPGGEGLVIVVNPRSGPDDLSPAEELRGLLPKAELIELAEGDDLDELLGEAAGRAQALGIAGGDGTVAAAALVALEHGLPLAVLPAGTLNHFAPRRGSRGCTGRGRCGRRGRRGGRGHRHRRRYAVPQHREHRELPADGGPSGGAGAAAGQVAGAVPGRAVGAAHPGAAAPRA